MCPPPPPCPQECLLRECLVTGGEGWLGYSFHLLRAAHLWGLRKSHPTLHPIRSSWVRVLPHVQQVPTQPLTQARPAWGFTCPGSSVPPNSARTSGEWGHPRLFSRTCDCKTLKPPGANQQGAGVSTVTHLHTATYAARESMGCPECETPSRIDGGEQVTVQDVYKVCVKGRARYITQHWM